MILCAVLKFTMVRLGQSEKKADRVVDHLDIKDMLFKTLRVWHRL